MPIVGGNEDFCDTEQSHGSSLVDLAYHDTEILLEDKDSMVFVERSHSQIRTVGGMAIVF